MENRNGQLSIFFAFFRLSSTEELDLKAAPWTDFRSCIHVHLRLIETARSTFTVRFMLAPTGAFLLFLVIASGVPVRAAQMQGPAIYGVDPTLAVITDQGGKFHVKGLPAGGFV